MRTLLSIFVFTYLSQSAFAQTDIPAPKLEGPEIAVPKAPDPKSEPKSDVQEKANKDLTVRSEAGRSEMLSELFASLKIAPDADSGKLVAEEIWAVFLQSGSASVDFALLRGIAAQNRGDLILARRMFNHVTRLQPDYAEGWARSGRLAIEEKDVNRAVSEISQSLTLEPRHFYSLWMLGGILEKLGKSDNAYEVYIEALKLYPEHAEIKERVEFLQESALGKAL
ncbi:MAG: hypothetical protein JKX72_10365 [Robiginitomaculum sp.]|nr:hypothetical protein [Robiginitomaculum sp.]